MWSVDSLSLCTGTGLKENTPKYEVVEMESQELCFSMLMQSPGTSLGIVTSASNTFSLVIKLSAEGDAETTASILTGM